MNGKAILVGMFAGFLMIPGIFLLVTALSFWWAWWLYPAWGLLIVPLGVSAISFWQFWALWILVHAKPPAWETKPKEEKSKGWADVVGFFLGHIAGPMFVYGLIKWMVS